MEEGYRKLLALGWEQTATLVWACRAIAALSTIMTVQQEQVTALRARVAQACQDMIFSNFYFDQFHAHLMGIFPFTSQTFSLQPL